MMIAVVVLAPLGTTVLILKNKKELHNDNSLFHQRYGTLTEGYRTNNLLRASWTIIFMIKRLATVAVLLFLISYPAF